MPIHFVVTVWKEGLAAFPHGLTLLKFVLACGVLYLLKWYFNGATNASERNMHSKVVMITVGLDVKLGTHYANIRSGRHFRHRR